MTKRDLPCLVAFKIRSALDERRMGDAERIAVDRLRAGYQSQEFWDIVAEMLEDKNVPRERGRPEKKMPPHWWKIGNAFLDLDGDKKPTQAIKALVKLNYGSRNTIRKAVKYFQNANLAHDEATAEFLRDKKRSK
jgi:hypothetical protein